MTKTFSLNGTTYTTDSETLEVLTSIIEAARESNDSSAVQAVLFLGIDSGRIEPVETRGGVNALIRQALGR